MGTCFFGCLGFLSRELVQRVYFVQGNAGIILLDVCWGKIPFQKHIQKISKCGAETTPKWSKDSKQQSENCPKGSPERSPKSPKIMVVGPGIDPGTEGFRLRGPAHWANLVGKQSPSRNFDAPKVRANSASEDVSPANMKFYCCPSEKFVFY